MPGDLFYLQYTVLQTAPQCNHTRPIEQSASSFLKPAARPHGDDEDDKESPVDRLIRQGSLEERGQRVPSKFQIIFAKWCQVEYENKVKFMIIFLKLNLDSVFKKYV